MGMCSYCYKWAPSWEECSSFDAAKSCAGITGPDDPVRLERKRVHNLQRALKLRRDAATIRMKAGEEASRLEREAESLVPALQPPEAP